MDLTALRAELSNVESPLLPTSSACGKQILVIGPYSAASFRPLHVLKSGTFDASIDASTLYIRTAVVRWQMLIKEFFSPSTQRPKSVFPFFSETVQAGFPSPAQDFVEQSLSLDELCIRTPAATFFVKAEGLSMVRAGIHDGDVLVVDRSVDASHWRIVIASIDGEFVCKRLDLSNPSLPVLRAEGEGYPDIHLSQGMELDIFGVVTTVVHRV